MQPPFNVPNVDDSGFYVPFYSSAAGPMQAAPFASQFATVIVKPRGGQPDDVLVNTLRRDVNKVDPNLPLYFVGTPKKHLDGFVGPNRIIATMFSIFGVGGRRARAGRHLRRDVVRGQSARYGGGNGIQSTLCRNQPASSRIVKRSAASPT